MRIKTSSLFLLSLAFFFAGCATAPVSYNPDKVDGKWSGVAQVKDFKRQKVDTISFETWAERPTSLLRMELTGTMGFSVASLLLNGQRIAFAVHPQKKFFSGRVSETSLRQIIHENLNPSILLNVFFDVPVVGPGWNCQNGNDGLVSLCERSSDHLKIEWKERRGELKRVVISNDKFELQILVKDFSPKVEKPEKTYTLSRPESYRSYKLN
jgi:hypothetical protein